MGNSRFEAVCTAGNREQCTTMGRVAFAAHRHEDMLNFMKRVVQIADAEGDDPTEEERGLLWEAYKSVVNALRVARNSILTEEELKREAEKQRAALVKGSVTPAVVVKPMNDVGVQAVDLDETVDVTSTQTTKDDDVGDGDSTLTDKREGLADDSHEDDATFKQGENITLGLLKLYRELIEEEICGFCCDFVKLLDDQVHAQDEESKAYFLQIKADHLRYICEVQTGKDQNDSAKKVLSIYLDAQDIAKRVLPARHPTRLGLALNFSVFHIDILGSKDAALKLSREAIQDVAEEAKTNDNVRVLGLFDESKSYESGQLLDMLKQNIELWSTDDDKENKEDSSNT